MLLIAVANDAATAGHPVTEHDRTFPPTSPYLGSDATCGQ
jgi:hypothetical protein